MAITLYIMKMYNQILQLIKCQHCSRLIDHRKLPLHEMMCSTVHLRTSKIFRQQKQKTEREREKDEPKQKCMFCLVLIEVREMDFHLKLGCKHRLVPCIDCEDMFPLSLFTEHLEVCRGAQQVHPKQEQWGLGYFVNGIKSVGSSILTKGAEAAVYCNKMIEQSKAPLLLSLQTVRFKIEDTFQDLFMSLAYQQNIQGMSRQQIRKIKLTNFHKNKSNGNKQQQEQQQQQQQQQEQLCTICLCEIQDQQVIKQLKCRHMYHPSCIDKWLRINRMCPLCKMDQLGDQ